jgi:hypothetical protein
MRSKLVHWKKVAEALFSDSGFVAAGKRRGFCRLPRSQSLRQVIVNAPGHSVTSARCSVKSRAFDPIASVYAGSQLSP